jgi:hypothetical protein
MLINNQTMKIILLLLISINTYGQHFNNVEVNFIDSLSTTTEQYRTDIKFNLNEKESVLEITEDLRVSIVKYDTIQYRRNGIRLEMNDSNNYFIINPEWVIHHCEYITRSGMKIVRSKYTNLKKV